jgi:ribosome-associated toxin RatA of RatAB toxin-antitoxin module
MRQVKLNAHVRGRKAAEVFSILCDLERYPTCSPAILSLSILERNGDRFVSRWEVAFQGGRLKWTEEDQIIPSECVWRFRQIEGDAQHLAGEWKVRDADSGCALSFSAEFKIGIPGLEAMFAPIAEKALRENMRSVIKGLLGDSVEEIE